METRRPWKMIEPPGKPGIAFYFLRFLSKTTKGSKPAPGFGRLLVCRASSGPGHPPPRRWTSARHGACPPVRGVWGWFLVALGIWVEESWTFSFPEKGGGWLFGGLVVWIGAAIYSLQEPMVEIEIQATHPNQQFGSIKKGPP